MTPRQRWRSEYSMARSVRQLERAFRMRLTLNLSIAAHVSIDAYRAAGRFYTDPLSRPVLRTFNRVTGTALDYAVASLREVVS